MARKSRRVAPSTESTVQVLPPSVVCATRPCAPLAHTTFALTTLSPRNSELVPLCCGTHCAERGAASTVTSLVYDRHARPLDHPRGPLPHRGTGARHARVLCDHLGRAPRRATPAQV